MSERPAPFQYAIFDFDGVIADTETVFARFDCALLNDVLVKAGLEPHLTPSYVRTLAGNNEVRKLEIVAEKYGFDGAPYLSDFKAARDATRGSLFSDYPVPLGKGVREFIAGLEGRCALATNKSSAKLLPDLELMEIEDLFSILVPCDPPLQKKPAPDILLEAVKRLGADIGDCAYIGDNVLDMQAASAAGMAAIGFVIEGMDGHETRIDALLDHGARIVLDDFADVALYFEGLS
jgi:HAD superfamily hydrolase (TIGR01509 family)